MSPTLLSVFGISPLSSLNTILQRCLFCFVKHIAESAVSKQYIESVKTQYSYSNISSEGICTGDTKAIFCTKEYLNRESEISCSLESSRNSQLAKSCPLLSHEQRSVEPPHIRAAWGWAGAGQGRTGLRACPRVRHKTITCHQNKPRAGEFMWEAMQRILQ